MLQCDRDRCVCCLLRECFEPSDQLTGRCAKAIIEVQRNERLMCVRFFLFLCLFSSSHLLFVFPPLLSVGIVDSTCRVNIQPTLARTDVGLYLGFLPPFWQRVWCHNPYSACFFPKVKAYFLFLPQGSERTHDDACRSLTHLARHLFLPTPFCLGFCLR